MALLTPACGGDDDDGVSISTSAENLCVEIAEVACHNMYQCCEEGRIEEFLGVDEPRSEDDCREDVKRRCIRANATRDWSIEEKRLAFNKDAMNDCLEALVAPSDTCALVDAQSPWAESCKMLAWTGLVADGGACYYDGECAGTDSYCAPNRICTARPTEGQACKAGVTCAKGLFCDGALPPATPTCKKLPTEGQACTPLRACAEDFYCDTSKPQFTCAAKRGRTEACTSSQGCKTGLTCIPGVCANSGSSCFAAKECGGTCSNNPATQCGIDRDCNFGVNGTCSVSNAVCISDAGCPAGETCRFPNTCKFAECVGNPVCDENFTSFNYCVSATNALPIVGGQQQP